MLTICRLGIEKSALIRLLYKKKEIQIWEETYNERIQENKIVYNKHNLVIWQCINFHNEKLVITLITFIKTTKAINNSKKNGNLYIKEKYLLFKSVQMCTNHSKKLVIKNYKYSIIISSFLQLFHILF